MKVILAGLLLIISALPGFSWNQGETFTFDPFLGLYQFDKAQKLDLRSYYGLRGGYNFTNSIGFEAMIGYVPTETESMAVDYRDVHAYRYGAAMLYHFYPQSEFVPFIAAGISAAYIDYPSEWENRNNMMFDYGAGLKYYVSEIVAIRGDLRQTLFSEEGNLRTNIEYTVGITFLIGGEETVCAPAAVHIEPPPVLVTLDDYHFEFGKAAVTKNGAILLDENIKILKANPEVKIRIAGYTSAQGTKVYNQKLSEKRAQYVRDYLVTGGILSDRIKTIGYGNTRPAEYEPLPHNINSKEAKSNMRVIFEILEK